MKKISSMRKIVIGLWDLYVPFTVSESMGGSSVSLFSLDRSEEIAI